MKELLEKVLGRHNVRAPVVEAIPNPRGFAVKYQPIIGPVQEVEISHLEIYAFLFEETGDLREKIQELQDENLDLHAQICDLCGRD